MGQPDSLWLEVPPWEKQHPSGPETSGKKVTMNKGGSIIFVFFILLILEHSNGQRCFENNRFQCVENVDQVSILIILIRFK